MNEAEMISKLQEENARLKSDNDMLTDIVAQMRVTLNRLILRYVSDEKRNS